jgi:hypothetical protein
MNLFTHKGLQNDEACSVLVSYPKHIDKKSNDGGQQAAGGKERAKESFYDCGIRVQA